MNATKKLPVPINPKTGQPRTGRDFLVPWPASVEASGFLGVESGRRHSHGALVFLGVSVTARDVRNRAAQSSVSAISALTDEQLDAYLSALTAFKVGNVLSISYAPDGSFALSKIAERCQARSKRKLP
jgi:hypothetical protein